MSGDDAQSRTENASPGMNGRSTADIASQEGGDPGAGRLDRLRVQSESE
jgi:hypothetical protein